MKIINNTNQNTIIDELKKNSNINNELDIFVAYISIKGLYEVLKDIKDLYHKINVYIGKRGLEKTKILHKKTKVELSKSYEYTKKDSESVNVAGNINNLLYEKEINSQMQKGKLNLFSLIHTSENISEDKRNDVFHGKVYIVNKDDQIDKVIIGSHNLTFNAHYPKIFSQINRNDYRANEISLLVNDVEKIDVDFFTKIKNNNSDLYNIKKIQTISELIEMDDLLKGDYFNRLATSMHLENINNEGIENFKIKFEKIISKIPFWDFPLAQHQRDAIETIYWNLLNDGGSFLSLPTGMGKTWVTLTLLYIFKMNGHESGFTIFVPNDKIKQQWENDWKKLTSFIDDVKMQNITRAKMDNLSSKIISYNSKAFSNNPNKDDKNEIIQKLLSVSFIVVEESHNLRNKSYSSNRKSTLDILLDYIDASNEYRDNDELASVLLVSATPINNSLLDLRNQIKLFPSNFKKSNVKEESMKSIEEITKVFDENKKIYEKEKSNDENFDQEKSQIILSERWDDIVNKSFSKNIHYNNYTSFINRFIYKGKSEELIDKNFDPTNDEYYEDKDKHVFEINYELEKEKVEEILNIFEDFKKNQVNKNNGLFGSKSNADSLFTMTFFKQLESSPSASLSLINNFIDKWEKAVDDPKVLEEMIDEQIRAEERRESQTFSITNDMDGEDEDNEDIDEFDFDGENNKQRKIEEKANWLRDCFASAEYQDIYRRIKDILKSMIIDFDSVKYINKDFFIKNPQFEKEKKLYFDLKNQEIISGPAKGYYYKTIVFAHYKLTASYLKKLISKFDFINEYMNRINADIDSIVYNASNTDKDISQMTPRKFVDSFSPLSRVNNEVEEYRKRRDDESWLKSFEDRTLKYSIMIATDSWSEGHNLQDATMLISYDTHWNPMRIMQRVGRIIRILTDDISHHIYERLNARKKIRYYWQIPNERVIQNHIDLNRIITFKMMQVISSGFTYPITFNDIFENGDRRTKRIREIITENTRGGFNDAIKLKEDSEISKLLMMEENEYIQNKIQLHSKALKNNKDKVTEIYNGTVVVGSDNISNHMNCLLYFIIEVDDEKMIIVPIKKFDSNYISLDGDNIDTNVFENGNILSTIYEESKEGKIINDNSIAFLVEDERKIKSKIIESIEKFYLDVKVTKENIKYYSIFIKELK